MADIVPKSSTVKKVGFVVAVAWIGGKAIRALGQAAQKSTNTTVAKIGAFFAG